MLGSNPSADSVASTDKRGCYGIPFRCLLAETPYRERHQSVKSWGCGGKAPACNVGTKLPSEHGRPLIMHNRSQLIETVSPPGTGRHAWVPGLKNSPDDRLPSLRKLIGQAGGVAALRSFPPLIPRLSTRQPSHLLCATGLGEERSLSLRIS